jgi:hypothetical protein
MNPRKNIKSKNKINKKMLKDANIKLSEVGIKLKNRSDIEKAFKILKTKKK